LPRSHLLTRTLISLSRALKLLAIFAYAIAELIVTRPTTRLQRAEWLHAFCKRAARQMGVAILQQGADPSHGIVISNHLGYLDIVAFAALQRCVYVAKAEIRRWPLLGWLANMAGTVYVERGRGASARTAGAAMQAAAAEGLPVVFFPEGTTSNGETVGNFHSGLLAQAMAAGQPITAASITYRITRPNGPGITVPGTLCYWDDTPLLVHIFRLLAVRGIEVEVRFADSPIAFHEGAAHRKQAAIEAREAVLQLREAATPAVHAP
jgi:1-acyl-sn-glycerol-3-phosphate acyltransferase